MTSRFLRVKGQVDTYVVTALVREDRFTAEDLGMWAFCWVWKSTNEDWGLWQWWVEDAKRPPALVPGASGG